VTILLLIVGLVFGLVVGYITGIGKGREQHRLAIQAEVGTAKSEAERILEDARQKAEARLKDAELDAQKKLLEQQAALDEDNKKFREEHAELEKRLHKKEETLDKRTEALDLRDTELKALEQATRKSVKQAKKRIKTSEELLEQAQAKLEEVAGMNADQAKQSLIDAMTGAARLEAGKLIKRIEEEAEEQADKKAKKIISVAVQRFAGEYVTERCVRTVELPSDEVKGRIIGREGRNIRAIEAATGVDLIIDDTPEPVRREIAALTLKRLIADGRIHPGRIEETVAKVTREVEQTIKEAGDQAVFELGLQEMHPEVLRLVGRLKYRTSYGQNIWAHAIEVSWLAGMMAAELGLNVKTARRAGLLHDIGKAMDHEMEGSHAIIGGDFLRKHGEDPVVINAVAAHHGEEPLENLYGHLVMAADALSGARPGARREILETYVKRLEDIERISMSFDGVEKCYAIQAGREIRVLVDPGMVDDDQAVVVSHDIARRIERELTYPGNIKVCVIRETRAVDSAR